MHDSMNGNTAQKYLISSFSPFFTITVSKQAAFNPREKMQDKATACHCFHFSEILFGPNVLRLYWHTYILDLITAQSFIHFSFRFKQPGKTSKEKLHQETS